MNNLKFTNKLTFSIVGAGYIVVALIAYLLHWYIIPTLGVYAIFTLLFVNYAKKRQANFIEYLVVFNVSMNEDGYIMQFGIAGGNN